MKRIFTVALFVAAITTSSITALAQSESRDDVLRKIEAKRVELQALEAKFLGASEEDLTAYTEFLQQPDTGITRRAEYLRFSTGVKFEDVFFKTRQPAIVNNTYVLRGIHYSDSDVLVAFRIVGKDLDDSVVILWKLLKKYPKPVLARAN